MKLGFLKPVLFGAGAAAATVLVSVVRILAEEKLLTARTSKPLESSAKPDQKKTNGVHRKARVNSSS